MKRGRKGRRLKRNFVHRISYNYVSKNLTLSPFLTILSSLTQGFSSITRASYRGVVALEFPPPPPPSHNFANPEILKLSMVTILAIYILLNVSMCHVRKFCFCENLLCQPGLVLSQSTHNFPFSYPSTESFPLSPLPLRSSLVCGSPLSRTR